jgi:2-polyprenyl-3-methyl-5-hydroxy-6-metoxy-1,4-benzoquinol methylase
VCGSSDVSRAFSVGDLNQGTSPESFLYLQCAGCGAIFIAEIPTDLSRHYGVAYPPYAKDSAVFEKTVEAERPKLEIVSGVARGRTLLEVGAASGAFATLAQRNGFEVTAIEMDPDSCTFMRSNGIVAIQSGDVIQAIRTLPEFNVIALWHVIEHLPNPAEAFRALASKLRPGGALVIAAPNPASPEFRLFRARWVHVDAPRHLTLIPRLALDRLARSIGLSPASPRHRYDYDAGFDVPEWLVRSLRNWFPPALRTRFVVSMPTHLIAYPLHALLDMLRGGEGNTYTRVFVRERDVLGRS